MILLIFENSLFVLSHLYFFLFLFGFLSGTKVLSLTCLKHKVNCLIQCCCLLVYYLNNLLTFSLSSLICSRVNSFSMIMPPSFWSWFFLILRFLSILVNITHYYSHRCNFNVTVFLNFLLPVICCYFFIIFFELSFIVCWRWQIN